MKSWQWISTLGIAVGVVACGSELAREYFPKSYGDHHVRAARQAIYIGEPELAPVHLRLAAENGDHDSMAWLGRLYETGTGVDVDPAQALDWYQRAVEAPDGSQARLLKRVGDMYARGDGTEADADKAKVYWERAFAYYSSLDSLKASDVKSLATLYARGQGTDADGEKAVALLKDYYTDGDIATARAIGDIYYDGQGMRRGPAEARSWYTIAFEGGDEARVRRLGDIYRGGDGVEIDDEKANFYYKKYVAILEAKSDDQIQDSEVRALATMYAEGRGVEKADGQHAIELLQRLVGHSRGLSERLIGDVYYRGQGLPEPDHAQAAAWYEKSIEQGDEARLTQAAQLYAKGEGVEKDLDKAQRYWALSLKQLEQMGDHRSPSETRRLAFMYANGEGTGADGARAVALLETITGRGDGFAERLIGDVYYSALGFAKPNMARAAVWYEKAVREGSTVRLERLGSMYAKGDGVTQSKSKSDTYMRQAAQTYEKRGDRRAPWETRSLARMYATGAGVSKDPARAMALYEAAAAGGDASSARYGGDLAYDLGEMGKARALYQQAMAGGDRNRLERYADMLAEGQGGAADKAGAAKLYTEYAKELEGRGKDRDPTYTLKLARLYLSGKLGAKDVDRALALLKSITAKTSVASIVIGDLYYKGTGVAQDYATAFDWYQKSVAAGDKSRLKRMAVMYERGQGVAKDEAKAKALLRKAGGK